MSGTKAQSQSGKHAKYVSGFEIAIAVICDDNIKHLYWLSSHAHHVRYNQV